MKVKKNAPLISLKTKVVDQSDSAQNPNNCVKSKTLQTSAMTPDIYYKPISSLCIQK